MQLCQYQNPLKLKPVEDQQWHNQLYVQKKVYLLINFHFLNVFFFNFILILLLILVIVRTRSNTDGSRMQRNDSLTEDILRPIMMKGRADSISRIINDSSNDPDDPNPRSSEPDNLTPLAFSFKKSTSDNSSKSNSNSNKGQKFPFSPTGQPIKGNRLSMWYVLFYCIYLLFLFKPLKYFSIIIL